MEEGEKEEEEEEEDWPVFNVFIFFESKNKHELAICFIVSHIDICYAFK